MDSALETALNADGPLVFWAVEIVGDGVTLRYLDGSGFMTIDGESYVGQDPTYGTWEPPAEFTDGIAAAAPTCAFNLYPPSDATGLTLLEALPQLSTVKVWYGAVNRTTGAVIGVDERFDGEIDVATLYVDQGKCVIGVECVSIWDRLFDGDEGLGLTDAAWQSIFPGELAFQYVASVQRQIPWGSDGPRASVIFDNPSGTGGGGTGGGTTTGGTSGGLDSRFSDVFKSIFG